MAVARYAWRQFLASCVAMQSEVQRDAAEHGAWCKGSRGRGTYGGQNSDLVYMSLNR